MYPISYDFDRVPLVKIVQVHSTRAQHCQWPSWYKCQSRTCIEPQCDPWSTCSQPTMPSCSKLEMTLGSAWSCFSLRPWTSTHLCSYYLSHLMWNGHEQTLFFKLVFKMLLTSIPWPAFRPHCQSFWKKRTELGGNVQHTLYYAIAMPLQGSPELLLCACW